MSNPRICSIEGCGKKHYARGWCEPHYLIAKRGADPLAGHTRPPNGSARRFLESQKSYFGDDCIFWPFTKSGSGASIQDVVTHRRVQVCQILCEHFYGPKPTPRHESAHSCGNGHLACVTGRHLRWATRRENMQDKLIHGTSMKGEEHNMVKINEDDVMHIRSLQGRVTHQEIADMFGLSRQHIGEILARKRWTHI